MSERRQRLGKKMLTRIKNAAGDIAETTVRAFVGPKVYRASQCFLEEPNITSMEQPSASVSTATLLSQPEAHSAVLLALPVATATNIKFDTRSLNGMGEPFSASTASLGTALSWPCAARSADIPKIDSPSANTIDPSTFGFQTGTRGIAEFEILAGEAHRCTAFFAAPSCVASIERAFMAPISVKSKDLASVPKSIWMRYTMHLVKETGENVKNLQIIGLYLIPKNGVKSMAHSASDGSIQIRVGAEAANSEQCTLVVARKKSDNAIISYIMDAM
ncbi:MAG: hypothetical protein LBC63_01595 [Holophagales bacterium]|jgi:hypothetical protein|nr:hypothetical protein [Holophagales bacterium]